MRIIPIKTPIVLVGDDIFQTITASIDEELIADNSVIVVSSKIVALCEGSVADPQSDREALIKQEADYWLDPAKSKYGHHFTIKNSTLVGSAGIDRSNGDGRFILWPKNPQKSANHLTKVLTEYYKKPLGVVLSDSVSTPLRRGTVGTAIAYSGFKALESYIGKKDLFGRVIEHSVLNRAEGIATAANLAMGEGDEQQPIAIVSGVPGLVCSGEAPSQKELELVYPDLDADLFEPFLSSVSWQEGEPSH